MRFGRRLALFFLLIAIVPTAALIAILLLVSGDSRAGKADARLAAGVETAVAVYRDRTADATVDARRLAQDPDLAAALRAEDLAAIREFAGRVAGEPGVARIELLDDSGRPMAVAGLPDSVAFARVGLTESARQVGVMRLSTTTAQDYVAAVRNLTDRQLVLSRGSTILASTVSPPPRLLEPDETADLTAGGTDYRAHTITINSDDGETVQLLGPPKSGGALGIGRLALAILVWFLVAAVVLAWAVARNLTGQHQRVAADAMTDPLTGLRNRRYMAETLHREVARALRFGHPISLIILDVDDFKEINDRLGHLQGDIVLERVADVVREATRTIDVAARYGGDEMALILVETGREGAEILGERIAERMRATGVPRREGGSMGVTVSVGVATIPYSAHDLESLVDAADRALLRAKRTGKNQIRAAPMMRPESVGEGGSGTTERRQPSGERGTGGKRP